MAITMPKSEFDQLGTRAPTVFPEGTWEVVLEEVRVREFPDFIASNVQAGKNTGYSSGDGTILGLQFGGARNEAGDTTNQKLFVDFVIRDGTVEIDADRFPEGSWQMARSRTQIMRLANALGALVEFEGDDGVTRVAVDPDFIDQLGDGEYSGRSLAVDVYHKEWKSATKSGINVLVSQFLAVD